MKTMTRPWFQKYNESFIPTPGQNDASRYDVSAEYREGAHYNVIGIHHLDQSENRGNHHIFVDVLDEDGKRIPNAVIAWTWQGRKETTPLYMVCDKPANEPAGNIPLHSNQTVTLWAATDDPFGSDRANGFHTRHPDEPPGNTWGHHSFYVVFQRGSRKDVEPAPPPPPPPPSHPRESGDPPELPQEDPFPTQGAPFDPAQALPHLRYMQGTLEALIRYFEAASQETTQ